MLNDDVMDQLLRDAMAADAPRLSPAFDARIMRRVRPRRLTTMGRVVIAVYFAVALAVAAWLMRDLPVAWIVAAIVIGAPVAAAASAYGRRLAIGH
jgi:hypothetical protein